MWLLAKVRGLQLPGVCEGQPGGDSALKEKKKKVTRGEVENILKVMAEKITSQETEKENLVSVIKSRQEDLSVIRSHLKEGEEVYENAKDPEGFRKFLDKSMEELQPSGRGTRPARGRTTSSLRTRGPSRSPS